GDSTTIEGDVMARGGVSLGSAARVTGVVGSRIEQFAPLLLPGLPPASAGSMSVTVSSGQSRTLAPGAYSSVSLQKNATLVLGQGDYVFRSLVLGSNAVVQYDLGGHADSSDHAVEMSLAPTEKTVVRVLGDLKLGSRAEITSGSSDRSNRLKLFAYDPSRRVFLGAGALFHGSLIAPASRVYLGPGSSVTGAVYARAIELATGASFRAHPHPEDAPLPSFPAAAMTAGPAGGAALERAP